MILKAAKADCRGLEKGYLWRVSSGGVMRTHLRARTMKHLKGPRPETDLNRPNTVMRTQQRARTMKHFKHHHRQRSLDLI